MQMASWKNYDKQDLCLVGFAGATVTAWG